MLHTVDSSSFIAFVEDDAYIDIDKFVNAIEQLYQAGIIICIEPVRNELIAGDDQLREWALAGSELFHKETDEIDGMVKSVREVVERVADEIGYSTMKVDDFFRGADGVLIAHAIVIDGCVVTEEAKLKKGKIQIPQICERMDVPCINMRTMLAQLPTEFSADLLSLLQE